MKDFNSTSDVTVLVPTKDRPDFLWRLLKYYSVTGFQGDLLIGDASEGECLQTNIDTINEFIAHLSIRHVVNNIGVNRTLENLSNNIKTEYCLSCTDDDFVTTSGIVKALEFLKDNKGYSAAHGKGALFSLSIRGAFGDMINVVPYPQAIINGNNGAERLKKYLGSPMAEAYSLHRVSTWKRMFLGFSKFEWALDQKISIDELICCGIAAIHGEIKEIEGLYLVRQSHKGQFQRLPPYELIAHRLWSDAVNDMRCRFASELMEKETVSRKEAEIYVEEAINCYLKNFIPRSSGRGWYERVKEVLKYGAESYSIFSFINECRKYISRILWSHGYGKKSIFYIDNKSSIYYDDFKYIQIACDISNEKN